MLSKHYILTLANAELLRRLEHEEKWLHQHPDSEISKNRINRFRNEEKELGDLILEEESKQH